VKGQPATIAIHSFNLETKVKTSTDERELVFKGFTSDILFDWFIRRRRA
jgi:hypothetical protein